MFFFDFYIDSARRGKWSKQHEDNFLYSIYFDEPHSYNYGTTKRIVFIADINNISAMAAIFSKLQSLIKNDILPNYKSTTLTQIFGKISPQSSLLKKPTIDLFSCPNNSNKVGINSIETLYDEKERNYLQNIIDEMNENKDDNTEEEKLFDKYRMTLVNLQTSAENLKNTILHDKQNIKGLNVFGIDFSQFDCENGDLSQILYQLDNNTLQIEKNTWRVNYTTKKSRHQPYLVEAMYCNDYYYHTLEHKETTLNYNIERDRKQIKYPKLYNIDYDCVDKLHRHDCSKLLRQIQQVQLQAQFGNDHEDLNISRIMDRFSDRNGCKDKYTALSEFYYEAFDHPNAYNSHINYGREHKDCKLRIDRNIDTMQDYDAFDSTRYYSQEGLRNLPTMLVCNMDRMYNIKLDPIVQKWYKNGKYLLYRLLPHEDEQETALSIDFCHFQVYYNRLNLLQSVYKDEIHDTSDDGYLSKCARIALNDCSRYCRDELCRQWTFSQENEALREPSLLQSIFSRKDDKATWDRRNKHRYAKRTSYDPGE